MMAKVYWLVTVLLRNEGISLSDLLLCYGFSRSTTLRDLKALKTEFFMDLRSGSSILDGAEKGYMLLDTGIIDKKYLCVFTGASSINEIVLIMEGHQRES